MKEKWKLILKKHYAVSSLGRVRRQDTGRLLTPFVNPFGYRTVAPSVYGKQKPQYLHRIIAEAFLGPGRGREVNHKDGDKSNNALVNLEWLSREENQKHARRLGLMPRGERSPLARLTPKAVLEIRRRYRLRLGGVLGREFGVSHKTIHGVVHRLTWAHL